MRYQYKDPSRTVICMTCVYLDLGPEPDVWSELLFPFHYFISWYHSCAWVASDFLSCESERTATQFQKLVPGGSGGFPWGRDASRAWLSPSRLARLAASPVFALEGRA